MISNLTTSTWLLRDTTAGWNLVGSWTLELLVSLDFTINGIIWDRKDRLEKHGEVAGSLKEVKCQVLVGFAWSRASGLVVSSAGRL